MNTRKGSYSPHVIVKKADCKGNIQTVPEYHKTNTSLPFKDRVYGLLPELKDRIHTHMTKEEIYQEVSGVIRRKFEKEESEIEKRVIELQQLFDEIISPAISKMLEIFEVEWPQAEKEIICYIGYYPVFPRDVMTKEFWVNYSTVDERILKASLHEINHFIMFEKWKSMHGYHKVAEPTHPEVLWFLEEIVVDPTLNEAELQKIVPYPQQAYPQFYEQTLGGVVIMDYIKQIYNKRESMEQFLDRAYEFLAAHIDELIAKCG